MPPVQVVLAAGAIATSSNAGSVPEKASAETGTALDVLSIVTVSSDPAPSTILPLENAADTVGLGAVVTVRESVAVPELPSEDIKFPVRLT